MGKGGVKMSDGGKGSAPRPIPDRDKFERNWATIFGKKETCNGLCGEQECKENKDNCSRLKQPKEQK